MPKPKSAPSDTPRPQAGRATSHDPLLPGMPLDQIGEALATAYDQLIAEGVPEHLAGLVRRVRHTDLDGGRRDRRVAVVVEDEEEVRALAESLLGETDLAVIACDSAERALAILRERGGEVAMVFADIRLAGEMDGVQLAHAVATLWPKARLVVTSGVVPEEACAIPDQAVFIPKPWRAHEVLAEAGRASEDPPPAIA